MWPTKEMGKMREEKSWGKECQYERPASVLEPLNCEEFSLIHAFVSSKQGSSGETEGEGEENGVTLC